MGTTDRRRELGSTTAAALGVVAALIGLLTAVLGLVKLTGGFDEPAGGSGGTSQSGRPGSTHTSASVFLNDESGPGGSVVKVSGEGFEPGERVTLRFHTEEVGRTRAGDAGSFSNVAVTIPTSFSMFAPQQFTLVATGGSSIRSASTAFTLTG